MFKKHRFLTLVIVISMSILLSFGYLWAAPQQRTMISVAVLYAGDTKNWQDIYNNYAQPLLMNLAVKAINIDKNPGVNLDDYDLVYPDSSVLRSPAGKKIQFALKEYVQKGGTVFLENALYKWLPSDMTGARSFEEIVRLPEKLETPAVNEDLLPIQALIVDFYENYKGFKLYDELKALPYGYGMLTNTAVPIVTYNNLALYTINSYGMGYVFFCNSLLPNLWYTGGFDMMPKADGQLYFNNTVSAANQMLRNELAAFVSKQKLGYALKKVFGPYGRPAAAWQNHFELLPAVKNQAMKKWIDMAQSHDTIASFSLARGLYHWLQRYESIGYQINYGTDADMSFKYEQEEAFYAPGMHPIIDNAWLIQAKYPKEQSYFAEANLPYRAYPYIFDLDGDGIPDILSGSADGCFYYYHGLQKDGSWILDKAKPLLLADGSKARVDGYSAPILFDIDLDGNLDLISGSRDGKIYLFSGLGDFKFKEGLCILNPDSSAKLSAPDIGDVDSDGVPDLILGTGDGRILGYKGHLSDGQLSFGKQIPLRFQDGSPLKVVKNAAPRLADLNGDQVNDLLVGTADGYVRKLLYADGVFRDEGYIDSTYKNNNGNLHFKYGNNAVPLLADINGDGIRDLIVGRLEYGQMAVGIDSPLFPYHDELTAAIHYAKEHFVPILPHYYAHAYYSKEEEQKELELHKKAFRYYGLEWEEQGTNQHTWSISKNTPVQTLWTQYESGLRWNSGFKPAGSKATPSVGTEYTWILPFYLCQGTKASDMLVYNASINNADGMNKYIGPWDTLLSYYLHVEQDIVTKPQAMETIAAQLDEFRDKYDYNFMTETQMAKAIMTQLNASVSISTEAYLRVLSSFLGGTSSRSTFEIKLTPVIKKSKVVGDAYSKVAGVKIEPGAKLSPYTLNTDADIYMRDGKDLYIGLNRSVTVFAASAPEDGTHVERINMPVAIKEYEDRIDIRLLDGGLQQIKLFSPKGIGMLPSKEWKVEKSSESTYVLTRFGEATQITIPK